MRRGVRSQLTLNLVLLAIFALMALALYLFLPPKATGLPPEPYHPVPASAIVEWIPTAPMPSPARSGLPTRSALPAAPTPAPTRVARAPSPPQRPSAAPHQPVRTARAGKGPVGTATWYCLPGRSICTIGYAADGPFAAAGPALRVGNWLGSWVTVWYGRRHVHVQLIDSCGTCSDDHPLDLYAGQFAKLGDLGQGRLTVQVDVATTVP